MCLEDIRLGRETQSGATTLVLTGADQALLPQAMSRIALVLNPPSAGVAFFHTGSTIVANQGIRLAAGDGPLILDIQKHGDLVRRAWRVRGEDADTITDVSVFDDAQGNNALATATIAGVADTQLLIDHVSGSFSAATAGFRMRLFDAAVILWEQQVFDNFAMTFPSPIAITAGNTANATIAAGGVGILGNVFLSGIRRTTVTAFGDITVYETHLHKN